MATLLLIASPAYLPFSEDDQQSLAWGGNVGADGNATMNDVIIVLEAMTSGQYNPKADINRDGRVDQEDLDIIMGNLDKSSGQKAGAN